MPQVVKSEAVNFGAPARSAEKILKFQFVDRLPVHRENEPGSIRHSAPPLLQLRNQRAEFWRINGDCLGLVGLNSAVSQLNDSFLEVNFTPRKLKQVEARQRRFPSQNNGMGLTNFADSFLVLDDFLSRTHVAIVENVLVVYLRYGFVSKER